MKTIWKYNFSITDGFYLNLPEGAVPLTAFVQTPNQGPERTACLWVEVEFKAKLQSRFFMVVGTGNPKPEKANHYIATFQDNPFVWHLYGE